MAWGSALGITAVYVGSLYLWPEVPAEGRNHPRTVKKRFASLVGACAAACVPLMRAITASPMPEAVTRAGVTPPQSLVIALGIEPDLKAAATSTVATLGLAVALFLGPLTHLAIDGRLFSRFTNALNVDSVLKLRDYYVAPASEEFAFRACVTQTVMWSGASTVRAAVFLSPMCFGAAHLHHFRELRRRTGSAATALAAIAAQFALFVAFALHLHFNPYEQAEDNKLDFYVLLSSELILFSGVLFQQIAGPGCSAGHLVTPRFSIVKNVLGWCAPRLGAEGRDRVRIGREGSAQPATRPR